MDVNQPTFGYTPGAYGKKRANTAQWVEHHVLAWEKRKLQKRMETDQSDALPLAICFSRKAGVGALEIADLLGIKLEYPVVDRQIIEHIAEDANINKKTTALFDERYPGRLSEFFQMLFGEKAFIKSDYTQYLFSTVLSLSSLEPTIFVGRGTHLILPRDSVLAVRLISSKEHRVKRLAAIFGVTEKIAAMKLNQIDKEQKAFFKKTFGKKDAHPREFDLVVNCDYLTAPRWVAAIVRSAFREKFGDRI